MNRDKVFQLLGELDDRYIEEAIRCAPEEASRAPERIVNMKKKRIITLAVAAALLLALGITAYAVNAAVATPEAAERVAREQLEEWKAMGLISQEVCFDGPADAVVELEEREGGWYWYGRIFRHCYDVRWYFGWDAEPKYGCSLSVDTLTGKITAATFYAVPDADREPTGEVPISFEDGVTRFYYDNFDDILPADLTVDACCSLLAKYWGFSGYRLGETTDDFYQTEAAPPDGSTPVTELSQDLGCYVTVWFDGDPDGAPMYLELDRFPGHVAVIIGTNHSVG